MSPSATAEAVLPLTPFRVDVRPNRSQVLVAPAGELDLATVTELREQLTALREAGFREVVVDLRGLTFLDSTGLRLLVAEARALGACAGRLLLVPGPPAVQRVFAVTGLDAVLDFVPRP